jgi:hypothetical protein
MTTTTRPIQLVLPLVALPGNDWPDQEPYASECRDGRPRSCPALIEVDGETWRYVGGLLEGAPEYRREVDHVQ